MPRRLLLEQWFQGCQWWIHWVVSSIPKGIGIAMGNRKILYKDMLASVSTSGVVTVMSLVVKAGPTWKQEGTLSEMTSVMQTNILSPSMEVYWCEGT